MRTFMPLALSLIGWITLLNFALNDALTLLAAPIMNGAGLFFALRFMRIDTTLASRFVTTICSLSVSVMVVLYGYGYLLGGGFHP
ncbi:hypothetical protein [Huaxiibacter chinensis]|uniref:hypothetical protein n=1 Tax=Huaxiibacter chinensis TaxID=2899785 RepID=UPI003F9A79FA